MTHLLAALPEGSTLIAILIVVVFIVAIIFIAAKHIVVGSPNEVLVVSGSRSREGIGYKTHIGGRTLVWPFIERVSRLSLRNIQVGLEVKAQSGGGTMMPIIVTGVANVKVSSHPAEMGNAIERFLGQPVQELQRVARETLEGGLRAVIGKMTPEEIVEDRDKFVATVMKEVTDDFRKLGLVIDSVNIQNVHDDEQYLESIARKARAEVISLARKAEAQRAAEAVIKEAEANAAARQAKADRDAEAKESEANAAQRAESAKLDADRAIAESDNSLKVRRAQLLAEERKADAAAHQLAESSRLEAERAIAESDNALRVRKAELAREAAIKEAEQQEAEVAVEQARLKATEVAQALAARDVARAKAEGDAAKMQEDGKARAAAMLAEGEARAAAVEAIGQSIQKHPDALKVMLVEMMPSVVQELAKSVQGVDLGSVTVIDGGKGDAIAGAALGRAKMLTESLATLESVLGIDMKQLSQNIAANVTKADRKEVTKAE